VSFRREAYVPKGGPDGGDGGNGGNVVIQADSSLHTLLDCQYRQLYRAKNGQHGMGKKMTGRGAEDLIIKVPVGTLIKDDETNEVLADLNEPAVSFRAAKGGRGGRGNARFASSGNRAPRQFDEGEPGEERVLRLELKLIADVGLVGFPNSGKSTLISRVSNAHPKIADYPFTTKVPGLGVVRVGSRTDFVMADIPGLIKNAHNGAGMGDRFLRHIERTRLLLHLVDPSPILTPDPEQRFADIMKELISYGKDLLLRPMIVVITKMDLPENVAPAHQLRTSLETKGYSVHEISAVSGFGVRDLLLEVAGLLNEIRRNP
jgi:GTPase